MQETIYSFNGDPNTRKPCRACIYKKGDTTPKKPSVVSNLQGLQGFYCLSCALFNSKDTLLTRLAWNSLSNYVDYSEVLEEEVTLNWKRDDSYDRLSVKDFILNYVTELEDNWLTVPEITQIVREMGFSVKKNRPHSAKYISEILRQLAVEGSIYRKEHDPKTKSWCYSRTKDHD